jgi:hypothetical protein
MTGTTSSSALLTGRITALLGADRALVEVDVLPKPATILYQDRREVAVYDGRPDLREAKVNAKPKRHDRVALRFNRDCRVVAWGTF